MADPLILTLTTDDALAAALDGLRRAHFPAALNRLPAHLTLFHHLPGDERDDVGDLLRIAARRTLPFPLRLPTLRSLGRGVAVDVVAPPLLALRARLASAWHGRLTPQDRQSFRPHVTIQNKVDPADARALLATLSAGWTPLEGTATGLSLWWYRGGPWELADRFTFAAGGTDRAGSSATSDAGD